MWAAGEPHRLTSQARRLLEDPASHLWFSAASLWEVAIKHGLGRADFRVEARGLRRGLLDNGWRELAISGEHAVATMRLPPIHKDPFDRLLIAQAEVEGFILLTCDRAIAQYSGVVRRV